MDKIKATIYGMPDRIKITTIFFVQINGTCEKVLVALKEIIDVVDNSDPKVLYSPLTSLCSRSGVIYFNSGPYGIRPSVSSDPDPDPGSGSRSELKTRSRKKEVSTVQYRYLISYNVRLQKDSTFSKNRYGTKSMMNFTSWHNVINKQTILSKMLDFEHPDPDLGLMSIWIRNEFCRFLLGIRIWPNLSL